MAKFKKEKAPVDPGSMLQRMERMMGGAVNSGENECAAQELVYDAWESSTQDEAVELLMQATKLDPTNVDAWLGLMRFARIKKDENIKMLRNLVEMGEKNLGEEFIRDNSGAFWGILETRPYMRARQCLAVNLVEAGRFEEATAEYETILKLNPNDNQGVRYSLMACYLKLNRLDAARQLFETHTDDVKHGAIFAWAYVLDRFLSEDVAGAKNALAAAEQQNSYAKAYFLGNRNLPKNAPSSYSMGSKEEAMIAWEILKPAWQAHPEAQNWLKENTSPSVGRQKKPKAP